MEIEALELFTRQPARVARWCGYPLLQDALHGAWLRQMICGAGDMTLLAHRGSYKTTCLAMAMAIRTLVYPRENMLFLRKTDDDVAEILRQVKMILQTDAMQHLSARLWGEPVRLVRATAAELTTACYAAPRGAAQLLGLGTGGSLTGKHADILFTDDIVNLADRLSPPERLRTRTVYQELQNIRNPGGRIVNTATPWHPEDAVSLMPCPQRFDCYATGLLTQEKLAALRRAMTPSLFAANYELKHVAAEGALFGECPPLDGDPSLLRDGVAHVDAAYGGEDCTALTCGKIAGDKLLLYGRLWRGHIDRAMDEILAECDRLLCGPILCETNGDKGYVAREMRMRGGPVRPYAEHMNKHVKIATFLRKWWPRIVFCKGTDRAYIDQILDYTESAAHDDAPDSAACLIRAMERTGQIRN